MSDLETLKKAGEAVESDLETLKKALEEEEKLAGEEREACGE